MPLALWMDPESIILNEVSQAEKDKYYMMSLICGIRKIVKMNLFTKQKQTHRHRKQTYSYQRGRGGERTWEFEINRCTLSYIKQVNKRVYCIAQGTIFDILQ